MAHRTIPAVVVPEETFDADKRHWKLALFHPNGTPFLSENGELNTGPSAYDVAVANGFEGTEEEWLDSLAGAPGAAGEPGSDGPPGEDGRSAYEVAVDEGFVGDVNDWLASLVGAQGAPGDDGEDGADGAPGADGQNAGGLVTMSENFADLSNYTIDTGAGFMTVIGGKLTATAQGAWRAHRNDVAAADLYQTAKVRHEAGANIILLSRWTDDNNFLYCGVFQSSTNVWTLTCQAKVAGAFANLTILTGGTSVSPTVNVAAGEEYWIDLMVIGDRVRMRLWDFDPILARAGDLARVTWGTAKLTAGQLAALTGNKVGIASTVAAGFGAYSVDDHKVYTPRTAL